jgi:hypothetical protein
VGVAGQRYSSIASSSSESSHKEGAASMSSTRVLGADMECVSSTMISLGSETMRLFNLCRTVSGLCSFIAGTGKEGA